MTREDYEADAFDRSVIGNDRRWNAYLLGLALNDAIREGRDPEQVRREWGQK